MGRRELNPLVNLQSGGRGNYLSGGNGFYTPATNANGLAGPAEASAGNHGGWSCCGCDVAKYFRESGVRLHNRVESLHTCASVPSQYHGNMENEPGGFRSVFPCGIRHNNS